MTTTPYIEALVAWLTALKEKGGKGVVGNIDARALGRVANALERREVVVKAALERKEARETLDVFIGSAQERDRLLLLHFACMDNEDAALVALDTPPEGGKL